MIMMILLQNEHRLEGTVHIGGATPNLEDESCELIHILRGERSFRWDGKWLYTESMELVSPRSISKQDLSTAVYGRIRTDSKVFRLLGFKKTEADEVDELRKTVPQEKLDAYFETELKQRYGISTKDLNDRFGTYTQNAVFEEENLPFPTLRVKSWEALRKHAAEMLIYADPVRYEDRIRSIRVTNRPREARAYLANMYRHDGNNRYKFACQLCHETCSSFDAAELFEKPETELDPLHLCLCPNCAAAYRKFRNNPSIMEIVRNQIFSKPESEIEIGEYVSVALDEDDELWFTQTHFAEIRELMILSEVVKNKKDTAPINASPDDDNEESGMSVYRGYIGKTIRRKDGFAGTITDVSLEGTEYYVKVHITAGKDARKDKKIHLSFIRKNKGVYVITE